MMRFWAKTTPDGRPGISVYQHMVIVGCVASCIAEIWPEVLELFNLRSREVGALAALHDLGKISPGFERKCEAWLEANGLSLIARNGCWDTSMESSHGKVTHAVVQDFLVQQGVPRNSAQYLSAALGAHHGRMGLTPNPRGIKPKPIGPIDQIMESGSAINWDGERQEHAEKVWSYFGAESAFVTITEESPALWWLAGLTSVADWIGSDERFFPSDSGPQANKSLSSIVFEALEKIGIRRPTYVPGLSFHDLFHDAAHPEKLWMPNEMQEKTLAVVTGPGVYVIEAPMGTGKTEAALWAAYQLLLSRKATGIYFALPTQMTSNRIHLRMNEYLRRISPQSSSTRLIHANSWLFDADAAIQPATTASSEESVNDARTGRDWFASTKRALIAPFGAGTIDQALLGVVAAKHFFVRHFALAGKVVVLDEVHSYDFYTGTLIDQLIDTLERLGCTVIVLSATLTGKRRGEIIACPGDDMDDGNQPYPLITGRRDGVSLEPVAATPPLPHEVRVDFSTAEELEGDAISLARKGGAVLWICNTVGAAQNEFRRLIHLAGTEFPIGLLHSRFPFRRRDQLEDQWMERLGKTGQTRCGSILVATQVVEQSVDLDADLLITELAPTDMLLQRLGRLWRHPRQGRIADSPRLCILEEAVGLDELRRMKPREIVNVFGAKAHVYSPFVLLRSIEVWKHVSENSGIVTLPSQIRQLIESTYREREQETASWEELQNEWWGTVSAKRMMARRNINIWQVLLDDEEGIQTRVNEIPALPLVLCRQFADREAVFIDGSQARLATDQYLLSAAQAIHRNLVKVPEYCFDHFRPYSAFAQYLRGKYCVGIVDGNGSVKTEGLQNGIRLSYSEDFGLVIEEPST